MIKVFKPYVNVANIPGDSFRELVANGKMSYQDFTKLQSWFSTYCPSGW